MSLKRIYKLYSKKVWILTLVTFIFIARKTIFNVTREVGTYTVTVDKASSLALLGICASLLLIMQNSSKINRIIPRVSPFLGYYMFATLSFIWAGNMGTILFKGIEVICSFIVICLTLYIIRSSKLALLYIIYLATTSACMDILNKWIRYGFGFYHTNAYTMTAMIALLLIWGGIRNKILNFKEVKLLFIINAIMLIAGTSSASYISFVIGIIVLFSTKNKKGINLGITLLICLILYGIYYYYQDLIFDLIFHGRSTEKIENGSGRKAIWEAAFKLWEQNPIIGNGFLVGERQIVHYIGLAVISAHNSFISVLVNTGITGMLIFVIFIFKWFYKVYHYLKTNRYACVLLPAMIATVVNCNAFPAIGSDWNYVAPSVYAMIAFVFINLTKYENNMDNPKLS